MRSLQFADDIIFIISAFLSLPRELKLCMALLCRTALYKHLQNGKSQPTIKIFEQQNIHIQSELQIFGSQHWFMQVAFLPLCFATQVLKISGCFSNRKDTNESQQSTAIIILLKISQKITLH